MEIINCQVALQKAIEQHQILIVQFGASSCGPCKAIQNKIKLWNLRCPDIYHVYISVEEMTELCAQMGVFTVPTVFVYVEGRLTLRESGFFSLEQILNKVENYRSMLE